MCRSVGVRSLYRFDWCTTPQLGLLQGYFRPALLLPALLMSVAMSKPLRHRH